MSDTVIGAASALAARSRIVSASPKGVRYLKDVPDGSPASHGSSNRPPGTGLAEQLFLLVPVFLCIGCANPGPPRPPSLHLPALVTDLAAERTGNQVSLHWTTPSSTTDGMAIKGPMMAQICREAGPRADSSNGSQTSCAPILRLAVVPGPAEVSDVLPPRLLSEPVVLLTYRIKILNSVERSTGDSAPAYAAAGAAPQAVDSFDATASGEGVVLEWAAPPRPSGDAGPSDDMVELTRTDLPVSPASKPVSSKPVSSKPVASKPVAARPGRPSRVRPAGHLKDFATADRTSPPPQQTHLRTQEPPSGTVDATAKPENTYTYTAVRLRPATIGPHILEIRSEPSSPVTIAMRDTFPPRSPAALATVPGSRNKAPYIDLSWEPNTESDLAGYIVYRQLAGANGQPKGPPARLTPSPVNALAYRDVAVSPGQRYIYWITAVDASGNESAPSAKTQEAVTPE